MKIDDIQWLINKKILNKRNIFFVISLIVICIVLFLCITLMAYNYDLKYNSKNSSPLYRTLIVYGNKEKYNELKDIDHVLYVESTKFYNGVLVFPDEFNQNNLKGEVALNVYFSDLNIDIVHGKNIQNDFEVICPDSFYPHSTYINKTTEKVYPSLFLNYQNTIGKSFIVPSQNEDFLNKKYTFTIVGTYNAKKSQSVVNSCYISKDNFDKIKSNFKSYGSTTHVDGSIEEFYDEYDEVMVRIDDYKNTEEVAQKIKNMGFNVQMATVDDDVQISAMISQSIFICLIVILISINIIYNFINKKRKYNGKYYSLLKCCGYNNAQTCKIEIIENIELAIISLIVALIIYFIIYHVLINYVLVQVIYNNFIIKIPFLGFCIMIIGILVLTILFSINLMKKNSDNFIKNLLGEK